MAQLPLRVSVAWLTKARRASVSGTWMGRGALNYLMFLRAWPPPLQVWPGPLVLSLPPPLSWEVSLTLLAWARGHTMPVLELFQALPFSVAAHSQVWARCLTQPVQQTGHLEEHILGGL